MNNNNLGEILHERRKSKKLTLKQVSERSGVHISHLWRIERGDRFPSARTLKRLAEPLGFGEVELLKLAGFMSRDEVDDKLDRFKVEIKGEIARAFVALLDKVDKL